MKKVFVVLAVVILAALVAFGYFGDTGTNTEGGRQKVVIWTSGEDYKNDYYLSESRKKFPEYDITLEYMNTSTIAAKVLEEKENCTADIIQSLEYGYLDKCQAYLAELNDFDFSQFLDAIVPSNHKYTPEVKNGGCIIINRDVMKNRNLPEPTSYQDLLNPVYKGFISMPNPATSGSGYMFLKCLVNTWGENEAFEYFDKLAENILSFTSSGSGPVNALVQGEVAIGLGMTSQAVVEKNQGVNLDILFFKEGSPFSMYGNAVLKKSAGRKAVMDVFNYIATDLCRGDNEKFFPDQIFKNFTPEIKGFPQNIRYGDMSGDTLAEKEKLLSRWTH